MATRSYDAYFILSATLKDEERDATLKTIEGEITRLQGVIKETQRIGNRPFARRLKKRTSGYYVRMRIELDPAQVAPLRERFKLNENVFRVQIVLNAGTGTAPRNPPEEDTTHGPS